LKAQKYDVPFPGEIDFVHLLEHLVKACMAEEGDKSLLCIAD
jgi:hypothetical protein